MLRATARSLVVDGNGVAARWDISAPHDDISTFVYVVLDSRSQWGASLFVNVADNHLGSATDPVNWILPL
jgi:hypothetical protein